MDTPRVVLTTHGQVQNLIADLFAAAKASAGKHIVQSVLAKDDFGAEVEIEVNLKEAGQQ